MTILVKMPQIWGKIRPKTHRFEAKIGQKSCILMQNDSIFGEKWRSEFLRRSCCSCCSFFSRGRCGWSFWWSKPVMVILVKIDFWIRLSNNSIFLTVNLLSPFTNLYGVIVIAFSPLGNHFVYNQIRALFLMEVATTIKMLKAIFP